jgi:NAD(P)-dependent dehydrogenase (short-subunit alcohol dehydrogenase family)
MPELTWPMAVDLSGEVAVVTGASQGIGAATAHALAAHGARVAVCARRPDPAEELGPGPGSGPGSVHAYQADMADAASVEAFLAAVESELGPPTVLINNVGDSPSRNFLHMTDADWTNLFELNLLSAVRCTRRLLPAMRARRAGRVVMVSTTGAKYPNPALIDYAATKAAMIATASALAKKYGPDGITVNSVLPGLVRTPMWERTAEEVAKATNSEPEAVFEQRAANVPLRRYASADEIAALIVFLVSPYGAYINGAALDIDGGLGAYAF